MPKTRVRNVVGDVAPHGYAYSSLLGGGVGAGGTAGAALRHVPVGLRSGQGAATCWVPHCLLIVYRSTHGLPFQARPGEWFAHSVPAHRYILAILLPGIDCLLMVYR